MTLLPQVSPPFITEVQPKMCHVNVKYVNRAVLYQVSFHAVCVHVIECVIGMCVCVCVFVCAHSTVGRCEDRLQAWEALP